MRNWPDQPGERRCINCDQRLIATSAPRPEQIERPSEPTVHYVCPDNHEHWAYDAQSRKWRQMY